MTAIMETTIRHEKEEQHSGVFETIPFAQATV